MSQTFRHPEILELVRRDGRVTVDGLARHFGVTLQTIRRDLADLAEGGQVERVHGGAILPSRTSNIDYEERRRLHGGAKAAIGRTAAALVPHDCSLFLAIGTSTEAVARELQAHRNLLVVTNNVNIGQLLLGNNECTVILSGGTVRRSDSGLVGPLAVHTIRQFKFDLAVLGCSALDEEGDLLDFDIQEVGVNQAILEQSRRVVLVADHSKLQRRAPARIASLRDIDVLVTDRALPEALSARCRDWETEVILTGSVEERDDD